ncbi:MAG: hypothetical protein LC753_03175 [Acidobacteria bacterium]|nr:hypothetical protein [Acidobacteriota bacterium]MCA1649302.1 hypothetical protein [Acidobacteriota bacterium]
MPRTRVRGIDLAGEAHARRDVVQIELREGTGTDPALAGGDERPERLARIGIEVRHPVPPFEHRRL